MIAMCITAVAGISLIRWLWPLLRKEQAALPVLLIQEVGTPFSVEKHASNGLSLKRVERLFTALKRKQFAPVLPEDIISGKLPKHPVLLVFSGGYQVYMQLLPLLEKYKFCATIALPVGLIGQYDAWNKSGPWQNLLTPKQISILQESKRIAFLSQGIDNTSLDSLDTDQAIWQLEESRARLKNLYQLYSAAILYPQQTPRRPAILAAAQSFYPLQITSEPGNNSWPLSSTALRIFPIRQRTSLMRLCWKMYRL